MEDVDVRWCDGPADLGRATVEFVGDALRTHGGRWVALAVGQSTLPLYSGFDPTDFAWTGRAITPVDELVPPPDDRASSFSARLRTALPEGLRPRLVAIDTSADAEGRAADLEARFQTEGLAAVVLGLGPDGHFAFNQPPAPADAPTRVVELSAANLARLGPVTPARRALTMGVATVLGAGAVLVVAAGPGKAGALEHLRHGPENAAWPVTWLRRHPRLTVAVDITTLVA